MKVEFGMRKWEKRKWEGTECGSGKAEVGRWNAEVGKKEMGNYEGGSGNAEFGMRKSEVGPAVVPNGRDYGAASMRKSEKKGMRNGESFDFGLWIALKKRR